MKAFFSLLFIFTTLAQISPAQKQAYNWTFSDSIRIDFTDLENPSVSSASLPILLEIGGNATNTTYSDKNGNLLAYFVANSRYLNGEQDFPTCKILDKNNLLFIDGDSIRGEPIYVNGAIFLPFTDNENKDKLYLITLSFSLVSNATKHAFYYHLIDLAEKKVIQKNKELYANSPFLPAGTSYAFDGKLAAVRHTNGIDWWLMGYDRNESAFLRWRVTPSGILGPFLQTIEFIHNHLLSL